MSSLYIENENSYYILYVYKTGSLSIDHYPNMKRVNACIERNQSLPIIYETIYKDHFVNKVTNILIKLCNTKIDTDNQLLNCLHNKQKLRDMEILIRNLYTHFGEGWDI